MSADAAGASPARTRAAGAESTVLEVVHETEFEYEAHVDLAYHLAHLRPRDQAGLVGARNGPQHAHEQDSSLEAQRLIDFALEIEPAPVRVDQGRDVYGNGVTWFSLYAPHDSLRVCATSVVSLRPRPQRDPAASDAWERVRTALEYAVGVPFRPEIEFVYASPFVPLHEALRDYAANSFPAARPVLAGAIELMGRIHRDFTYSPQSTEISTPVLEAFSARRGVCQDFAHVMIAGLRSLGLAARYVSGYLLTRSTAGKPNLTGADASHAWVSVHCPPFGWIDLDPTNDLLVDTSHVVVAIGRDYGDVMPLRGVIRGGGHHTLKVAVSVLPRQAPVALI